MDLDIKIVNIHDFTGDYVYVGRGSPLGNPFFHKASKFEVVKVASRSEAIEEYRIWLVNRLLFDTPQSRAINDCVIKLSSEKKIVLGCFCFPKQCHAEVIAEILKERVEKMNSGWNDLFEQ